MPGRRLTLRVAVLRVGIVASIVAAGLVAGAVNGVGPLAQVTPPNQVADPREVIARSLQSAIDASSVHVVVSLAGHVPGALVGRSGEVVDLNGTQAVLDLRPQDARSHVAVASPSLGIELEAVTHWDALAYRTPGGAWATGSLGSLAGATGIDANPLTLVDRLRAWLAAPGAPMPQEDDVACDAPSGQCRQVTLSLGSAPGSLLAPLVPGVGAATLGATRTDLVLLADAATLRPAHLVLMVRNGDGSLALTVQVDTSSWDWPSVIPDPPGGVTVAGPPTMTG